MPYVLRRALAPFLIKWVIIEHPLVPEEPAPLDDPRLSLGVWDQTDRESLPDITALAHHLDQATVKARLAAGHIVTAVLLDGDPIAMIWARSDAMWLPFLRKLVPLEAGTVYIYDSYTHPDHRGRGLTSKRRGFTHNEAIRRGFHTVRAYILAENAPALASARSADYTIVERNLCLRVFGYGLLVRQTPGERLPRASLARRGRDSELSAY